jgi:hypothetical protein
MTLLMITSGILTLALLVTTPPRWSGDQVTPASAATERTPGVGHRPGSSSASSANAVGGAGPAVPLHTKSCPLSDNPAGYRNPLAGASVTAKRIDQGVDYAGSGVLSAIGSGRITYLATTHTGWPGAFIEYQLVNGANRGCYVFYAEGVTPVQGLHVGQTVRAGQAVATLIPTASSGIEIGWSAGKGTTSYAADKGQWNATHEANDIPSAAGVYFSSLIAALGGPPGKVIG